jgi:hypothetical protein
MKQALLAIFLASSSLVLGVEYAPPSTMGTPQTIDIENRVLLKVNSKVITIMDLVRKMDLLFYRQYPELASSEVARFQFYSGSWEPILQMVIDEELMLADAEEKKIPITDGEVRQEMEGLFGPHVVLTLDKLNLSFEEAFNLIKRELIVQKMTSAFVRSRAMSSVSPAAIRVAYQKMIEGPAPSNSYVYRYIVVKGESEEGCREIAQSLCTRARQGESLETLAQETSQGYEISLSEAFKRLEEDISLVHLKELKKLKQSELSDPILQKSRTESPYYRIFVLEEYKAGAHPSLQQVEAQLKQQLMQEAYVFYNDKYRTKLRQYYDINKEYLARFTPQEFKPFALR